MGFVCKCVYLQEELFEWEFKEEKNSFLILILILIFFLFFFKNRT